MSPYTAVRRLLRSPGRHRPGTPPAPAAESPAFLEERALVEAIEDGDIEANEWAFCTAEQRTTFHAIHTDGSRTCWTCGTTTGDS
ncbi:hypothetical protein [Streptomyces huasconensis]|uniref:hypothetical protein n=1 Tax=Streptomyces huasconensis TaxID=1854574 RepID=UPI003700FDC0